MYEVPDVVVVKDSGRALLCIINGDEVWVPHSQITDDSEVYREGYGDDGSEGTLRVTDWLARKEGWT